MARHRANAAKTNAIYAAERPGHTLTDRSGALFPLQAFTRWATEHPDLWAWKAHKLYKLP